MVWKLARSFLNRVVIKKKGNKVGGEGSSVERRFPVHPAAPQLRRNDPITPEGALR